MSTEAGGNQQQIEEELLRVKALLEEQTMANTEAQELIKRQRAFIDEQAEDLDQKESQLKASAVNSEKYRRKVRELLDSIDNPKPEPTATDKAAAGLAIIGGVYAAAKGVQAGVKWWRNRNTATTL